MVCRGALTMSVFTLAILFLNMLLSCDFSLGACFLFLIARLGTAKETWPSRSSGAKGRYYTHVNTKNIWIFLDSSNLPAWSDDPSKVSIAGDSETSTVTLSSFVELLSEPLRPILFLNTAGSISCNDTVGPGSFPCSMSILSLPAKLMLDADWILLTRAIPAVTKEAMMKYSPTRKTQEEIHVQETMQREGNFYIYLLPNLERGGGLVKRKAVVHIRAVMDSFLIWPEIIGPVQFWIHHPLVSNNTGIQHTADICIPCNSLCPTWYRIRRSSNRVWASFWSPFVFELTFLPSPFSPFPTSFPASIVRKAPRCYHNWSTDRLPFPGVSWILRQVVL